MFHHLLRDYAALPKPKRKLIPVAWAVVIAWFVIGIGPGAVIGNTIFGMPDDASTWTFGIPSIWAWQIMVWILGVAMMWFLAYKMELSTFKGEIRMPVAAEDVGDTDEGQGHPHHTRAT